MVRDRNAVDFLKNVSRNEVRALFLGLISIVIYSMVSVAMLVYNVNSVFVKCIYGASVSVIPFIVFFVQKACFSEKDFQVNKFGKLIFFINLFFFIFLTVAVLFGFSIKYLMESQTFLIFAYLIAIAYGLQHGSIINGFIEKSSIEKWLVYALVASVFCAFLSSLYFPFIKENFYYLKNFKSENSLFKFCFFLLILLSGAVFIGWAFFRNKSNSIKSGHLMTIVALCVPLLLFDIFGTFDIEHYNAYLGPAIAVLHGKIPLVDVFCQYGLSYLVFTIGYIFFPNNYVVASFIVSILNVIAWVGILLILKKMVKNPIYFLIISITYVLGSNYILAHSVNIVPSTLSMRYLPTIFLTYYLLCRLEYPSDDVSRVRFFCLDYFNVLAIVNIFWNIETLISLSILYAAYCWILSDSFRTFFKKLSIFIIFVSSAYVGLVVVYRLAFHEVPDYGMYLRYIYAYVNPYIKAGGVFLSVQSDLYIHFYFWVVIAVMHLVTFVWLINHRFVHKVESNEARMLIFLNVAGILFMSYFVLQPTLFSILNSGCLSFVMIFSILLMESESSNRLAFKLCAKWLLFFLSFFFFFVLAKGFFVKNINFYKGTDLLYSLIDSRGYTMSRLLYNLTNFCSNKNVSPGAGESLSIEENTCQRIGYHQELYDVMKKWYSEKKEVLLFHRESVEVLMEHGKVHKLLVNPINDSLVQALREKTLGWVSHRVHVGDIVVVEKDLNILPIEYQVLRKMGGMFNFILLEETPHLKVFQLTNKNLLKKTDLVFPLNIKESKSSFNYIPMFDSQNAKLSVPALFDNDKETIWSVKGDILKKTDTFWIWMDMGYVSWIENIKIWRRIDFRKPDYVAIKGFKFANHFNIELSEDNKTWFMVTSENNVDIKNQYYFQSNLDHKKARYLRFNFLVDKNTDLSISEIEVFGHKVDGK